MPIGRAAVSGLRWPADADADADVVAAQLSHTFGFEIAAHSSAIAHCSATEIKTLCFKLTRDYPHMSKEAAAELNCLP